MSRSDCVFKFLPKDDELVLGYLLKKVNGEPLPSADVIDCEIYGDKEPWKIFGKTSKKSYVFTKLKKKGEGKRIERRVGCGTWKGQNTNPVKDSQNNHVGYKKLFVFEVKGSGSNNADNGHWLMHEYSLVHVQSDYVLCAIKNKHGIDVVDDDEPQQKRIRFNEDEQNSFTEAATPASNLASDEALGFAAASNAFTEQNPAYTLAPDHESLTGFAAASNAFTEPTPAYTFASEYHEALTGFTSASNAFTGPAPAYTLASDHEALGFAAASDAFTEPTPAFTFASDHEALSFAAASFTEPGPTYTLASDHEALGFAAASNAFTEPTPAYTFASDHEALTGFAAASNAFTEPTPAYTFASKYHEALTGFVATSNCGDGLFTNGRFAMMLEESYRDLYKAEDARQALISNASIQDTIAFQQQSMMTFSNNNAMEDMQTTAAESTYTSVPALEYINAGVSAPTLELDSAASTMAFSIEAKPSPAPTLPSDEALTGFAAAANAFTEPNQASTLAPDYEALIGLAAISNCEDHGLFSSERFAISLAELMPKELDRDLFEAEDARQVLIPNESVQAITALELNRSFQQQSMERFNNNNAMEDMQASLTTAAESYTL